MAIQIRRGSNAEWETNNSNIVVGEPAVATDSKRAFIGTASGAYMELANLEAIAPKYDSTKQYGIDDYVSYQGKLYVCTVPTSGAWNTSAWQETTLGQALAENQYSNFETLTVSGNIVSIDNGAGGIPVKDLKAEVVATQNLNGYDHPWVGGAGKNKLEVTGTTTTTQGITFNVSQDGTITVSGTFQTQVNFLINATCYLKAGDYILSGIPSAPSWSTFQMYINVNGNKYASVSGTQFTVDTDGEYPVYVSIYGAFSGTLTFKPMIRLASETDATFAPYSNICPISGWDEVNVTRTGKNLLPIVDTPTYSGLTIIKNNDGSYNITGKPNSNGSIEFYNDVLNPIRITEPCIFTSGWNPQGNATIIFSTAESSVAIQSSNSDTLNIPIGEYTRFRIYVNSANTYNFTFKPMVRLATESDATYHPYNGTTYTIDLDGTRYGGTLDVTTGVLTITHECIDLGTYGISGTAVSSNVRRWYTTQNSAFKKVTLCNSLKASDSYVYESLDYASISFDYRIVVTPTWGQSITTVADFNTAIANNPISLVIELATPQTVQLTPIQVRTLLGLNNIWADSGEVEVTYRISNVQ